MRLLRRLFIPGLAAVIAMPLIPSQTVAASFSGPTAYVVNNGSNTVTPIATATNTAGAPITVGSAPDAIAITPNGATAYVVNNGSNSVTPIATATNTAGTPINVGSAPDAIAISPNGATAYVTNGGDNTVTPIATATRTAGTAIAVGSTPDAIAITPNGATAYVVNNGDNTVTPIATATNTAGTPIAVGSTPDAIAITPNGVTAYVTNRGDNTATPVTTATNIAGAPIAVGSSPAAIAITPGGTTAWVVNMGSNTVTRINTATNTTSNLIHVGSAPDAIAISPDGTTAYVANKGGNNVTPENATTNNSGPAITVGSSPAAIAITPDQSPIASFSVVPAPPGSSTAFDGSASAGTTSAVTTYVWQFGDGSKGLTTTSPRVGHVYAAGTFNPTLVVIDSTGTANFQVFTGQTMSRNGGPAALAKATVKIAFPGVTAYVVNKGSNTVTPIATASNTAGPPITVSSAPDAIAITPNGATAYVVNNGSNTVTPIATATNTAGTPIAVGSTPDAIAITPNGATAYVVNNGDNTVTPIATATNTAGTPIAVGHTPTAIAITPNGATAYVTNGGDNTVTPIATATNTAGAPVKAGTAPSSVAITPNGITAYVVDQGSNTALPITISNNGRGIPITIGSTPVGIAITPSGATVYIANQGDNTVTPIATATRTAGTAIAVGTAPDAVAVTPSGVTAYVVNNGSNAVTPIATAGNIAGTPIAVGTAPTAIAITPDQSPIARFSVRPAPPGSATTFDASASAGTTSPITRYIWQFGDGAKTKTTSPTVAHTYAAVGTYNVTLTVLDSGGTSNLQVFTGQTMSNNGGPAAQTTTAVGIVAVTTNWLTYHLDPGRSGNDTGEPSFNSLTSAWNGNTLDGFVEAEPLINGNTVIVATLNNSLYAYNATSGALQWGPVHLGAPRTTYGVCTDLSPLGISSTPVIDGGFLYVVPEVQTSPTTDEFHLAKVNPSNGAVSYNTNITPTGMDATLQKQRPALTISNGNVVIGWGGLANDCGNYHGYLETVSESTGTPQAQWNDTSEPGGRQGGIWGSSGPVVDGSGNIYVNTGNGSSTDITNYDYTDSVLKFSPALALQSWFAPGPPQTWVMSNATDSDLGSTGPALLPNGLIFAIGKGGWGYMLNQASLPDNSNPGGGENFSAKVCNTTVDAAYSGLAVSGNTVFVPCSDGIAAVRIDSATAFHTLWYQTSGGGSSPIVAGGLVWTVAMFGSATLYGLSPDTGQIVAFLSLPVTTVHFVTPAAADGMLFIAAGNRLAAFKPS